ncbi:MAG: hypothetical protein KAV42_11665 [Candidatus Krumholzibacteria bacterium]|nr:hypothetical protein [Candidatus Krumholzibacteria bacterium]
MSISRSNLLYSRVIDFSIVMLLVVCTAGALNAFCPIAPPPQQGIVELTVITVANGGLDTIAARCTVHDVYDNQRYPPPAESLYHSAGGGYFYSTGLFTVAVPTGGTSIRVGHGFDFRPAARYVDVQTDTTIVIEFERMVKDLTPAAAGPAELVLFWDGRDDRGKPVASGLYFFRLVTESVSITRKIILMK